MIKRTVAISDSGFIFDSATGESYSTNEIGLEILNYIKSGKTEEEIIDHIVKNYEITKNELEKHYIDFISTLKYYKFLE